MRGSQSWPHIVRAADFVRNVLQTLNGSVNTVWVGQFLGEASLAATSNAKGAMFLLLGGVFGLSKATRGWILSERLLIAMSTPQAAIPPRPPTRA
jgi:hypothetical protein